jgi:hypothetical protein
MKILKQNFGQRKFYEFQNYRKETILREFNGKNLQDIRVVKNPIYAAFYDLL